MSENVGFSRASTDISPHPRATSRERYSLASRTLRLMTQAAARSRRPDKFAVERHFFTEVGREMGRIFVAFVTDVKIEGRWGDVRGVFIVVIHSANARPFAPRKATLKCYPKTGVFEPCRKNWRKLAVFGVGNSAIFRV